MYLFLSLLAIIIWLPFDLSGYPKHVCHFHFCFLHQVALVFAMTMRDWWSSYRLLTDDYLKISLLVLNFSFGALYLSQQSVRPTVARVLLSFILLFIFTHYLRLDAKISDTTANKSNLFSASDHYLYLYELNIG